VTSLAARATSVSRMPRQPPFLLQSSPAGSTLARDGRPGKGPVQGRRPGRSAPASSTGSMTPSSRRTNCASSTRPCWPGPLAWWARYLPRSTRPVPRSASPTPAHSW